MWEHGANNWALEQVLQPENEGKKLSQLKVWAKTRSSGPQASGAKQKAGGKNGDPLPIATAE